MITCITSRRWRADGMGELLHLPLGAMHAQLMVSRIDRPHEASRKDSRTGVSKQLSEPRAEELTDLAPRLEVSGKVLQE